MTKEPFLVLDTAYDSENPPKPMELCRVTLYHYDFSAHDWEELCYRLNLQPDSGTIHICFNVNETHAE